MRSTITDILPPSVRRALAKLGSDLSLARRKRKLTTLMMAERLGVAKSTYLKLEKGDPTVALGTYAMAFYALGFGDLLGDLLDPRRDEQGLMIDAERVPQRVRRPRTTSAL